MTEMAEQEKDAARRRNEQVGVVVSAKEIKQVVVGIQHQQSLATEQVSDAELDVRKAVEVSEWVLLIFVLLIASVAVGSCSVLAGCAVAGTKLNFH